LSGRSWSMSSNWRTARR